MDLVIGFGGGGSGVCHLPFLALHAVSLEPGTRMDGVRLTSLMGCEPLMAKTLTHLSWAPSTVTGPGQCLGRGWYEGFTTELSREPSGVPCRSLPKFPSVRSSRHDSTDDRVMSWRWGGRGVWGCRCHHCTSVGQRRLQVSLRSILLASAHRAGPGGPGPRGG